MQTAKEGGLKVTLGQYSTAGRKPANQDFHGALVPTGAPLALKGIAVALADGISSSLKSGIAAETAVKSLLTDYYCTSDAWTVQMAVSRVIEATNAWLYGTNRRACLEDVEHGQVCTLAALVLKSRTAHLFHVGDSRIWRAAGDALEPLTEDHRIVLSSQESYLGRALGAAHNVEIDYRRLAIAPGDTFLLTTDGLHEFWEAGAAARLVAGAEDLDAAAKALVDQALAAGSDDNLTLQIVRIESVGEARPDEVLDGALALRPLDPPEPGAEIDGYRIVRALHRSSRSHLFLAVAPDGTRVALKAPSVDLRGEPDYLRRFAMEEWVARRISHPHVLKAAPAPGRRSALYTVTEFLEGETLRQWMIDHPRPSLAEIRGIVDQIIEALRAFHRQGMVHQDLRPENVMIDPDGRAVLIDFGSARVGGVEEAAPSLADEGVLGTLQYAAPECFAGAAGTWRSDLYSLGAIAYEMLTGGLPYGTDVARVRSPSDQRRLRYRPARDDRRGIPDWADEALFRAVHPDPLKRYDALSEFSAALHRPRTGHASRTVKPLAERNPVAFWKTVSAVLAALVVFLLLRSG